MRWLRYTHVFFDCDSTLTTVEGIDLGPEQVPQALLDFAMDRASGPVHDLVHSLEINFMRFGNTLQCIEQRCRLRQSWQGLTGGRRNKPYRKN